MRILIAEDERDLNNILTERLRKEHYSVDACFDGQEAWDYLEGAEYDALILDIMMPVMDGLTLLKKIRSRGNPVPVLLLTAKDSIEDRVKGLDAGANDYLVKPFAFEELLARIRALGRRNIHSHSGLPHNFPAAVSHTEPGPSSLHLLQVISSSRTSLISEEYGYPLNFIYDTHRLLHATHSHNSPHHSHIMGYTSHFYIILKSLKQH